MEKNFKQKLASVKLLAFDIDGVLTDGTVTFLENGEVSRNFFARDGYAIERAAKAGLLLAIVSSARSATLKARFEAIGVSEVFLDCTDKLDAVKELEARYDLSSEEILYMGDDLPDYEAMQRVGIASCPDDAAPEIRMICQYVSPYEGGRGCVRDVIEQTLKAQNKW